jgi:hypothetical protein
MHLIQPAFDRIGQPLTADQTKSLFNLLVSANDTKSTSPVAIANNAGNDADRILQSAQQRQSRILEQAAAFLNPAQLDALRQQQASQLQMLKVGIQMSHSLTGGKQ